MMSVQMDDRHVRAVFIFIVVVKVVVESGNVDAV